MARVASSLVVLWNVVYAYAWVVRTVVVTMVVMVSCSGGGRGGGRGDDAPTQEEPNYLQSRCIQRKDRDFSRCTNL